MEGLRRAYEDARTLLPGNDLVDAMQTGDRISYRPETALKEIERLPGLTRSALASLEAATAQPQVALSGTQNNAAAAIPAEQARTRAERLSRAKSALNQVVQ
jgi:hypothetical protein